MWEWEWWGEGVRDDAAGGEEGWMAKGARVAVGGVLAFLVLEGRGGEVLGGDDGD